MAKVKAVYWLADYAGDYPLSSVDSSLFTHVFCGMATVEKHQVVLPKNFPSKPQMNQLRKGVKVLLSIGGTNLASMAADASNRAAFIASSRKTARDSNCDGIDLYYSYPCDRASVQNLASLLQEWRAAIEAEILKPGEDRLLLTAAVWYSSKTKEGFNYPGSAIAQYLDWINVMPYDFHTPTGTLDDPTPTAPAAALYSDDHLNGDQGITDWVSAMVPRSQIVLGIPFYGYAWTLKDPNNNGYWAPSTGPAITDDGLVTYQTIRGTMGHPPKPRPNYGNPPVGNYWSSGSTWISFDGEDAVKDKAQYVIDTGLRGYFGWRFGGDGEGFPLATAASSIIVDGDDGGSPSTLATPHAA